MLPRSFALRKWPLVSSLAVLSLHTSPLVQPGAGDSGGMNVYVRELVGSLARAGVASDVFVRRWHDDLPEVVEVEPGFRVVHVTAGPSELAKEDLPSVVPAFAEGVRAHLRQRSDVAALHANYWLSGMAAHRIKHELGLPLVSTFHTLARVKAISGDAEPERRVQAEAEVIGCADVLLASCRTEAEQLVDLYDAQPDRIEVVPPGVDHAFFSPGDRRGARTALGLDERPVVLFAGRIQPLKRLGLAVEALASSTVDDAVLVVVGGPSGPDGADELAAVRGRISALGLEGRVRFVPPQPHHLLSSWYRAADVVLVPSRSESFGLVALEAAACGVPVVAAAVGGLTTVVDDGRTGHLVDGDRPSDYAARIDDLLRDDRSRRAMGAAAADHARRYTWSTTAARLRRIYADVASRSLVRC
ncbi:MAG: glycosyltransferase [Acidimicrobiia bacterium]|nr:glycosyltransferase [Acidimicrobiia bacterium]